MWIQHLAPLLWVVREVALALEGSAKTFVWGKVAKQLCPPDSPDSLA